MKTTLSKLMLGLVVALVLGLSTMIVLVSSKAYAYEEYKTSPINEYTTQWASSDINVLHQSDDYNGVAVFDQYSYSLTYTKGGNSLTARLFDMEYFFINYSYNYTNILFGMNYYVGYDFSYPIYDDYYDNLYCLWFLWSYDDDMPVQTDTEFYEYLVERSISNCAFTIYDPSFYDVPLQLSDSCYFTTYYVGSDLYQINQILNRCATDEAQNYGFGFLALTDLIDHIDTIMYDHELFTFPFIQPLCTPIMTIEDNTTIIGYSQEQVDYIIQQELDDYKQNDGYRAWLDAFNSGQQAGEDIGFRAGYQQALEDNDANISNYGTLMNTTWNSVSQFLNTPILGRLTILHIILIPLLLGLLLIVLKLIRG